MDVTNMSVPTQNGNHICNVVMMDTPQMIVITHNSYSGTSFSGIMSPTSKTLVRTMLSGQSLESIVC